MNSNLNGARWDGISIAFQVEFKDVHTQYMLDY